MGNACEPQRHNGVVEVSLTCAQVSIRDRCTREFNQQWMSACFVARSARRFTRNLHKSRPRQALPLVVACGSDILVGWLQCCGPVLEKPASDCCRPVLEDPVPDLQAPEAYRTRPSPTCSGMDDGLPLLERHKLTSKSEAKAAAWQIPQRGLHNEASEIETTREQRLRINDGRQCDVVQVR